MDMRRVSGVADVFILCTGDSDLQIKAIAESVSDRIREECGEKPWHTEGAGNREWVLLDYVDLVVHVFSQEKRQFYNLERLWGDAPVEEVPETGSGDSVRLLDGFDGDAAPTDGE
jgi:ribosome-associated protein